MGFSGGSVVKNLPVNAQDTGLIPGPGRSHVSQSKEAHVPQLLSLYSKSLGNEVTEACMPQCLCSITREATATGSLCTKIKE